MSENIEVLIWRSDQIDEHGDLVTPQALQDMADRLTPGLAIPLNFDFRDIVGHIVKARVNGKELWATICICDPSVLDAIKNDHAAIRPSFGITASHTDNGAAKRVIDHIDEVHAVVTSTPMNLPGLV